MRINQAQLIQVRYFKDLFPLLGRRPVEGAGKIKKCFKTSLSRQLF